MSGDEVPIEVLLHALTHVPKRIDDTRFEVLRDAISHHCRHDSVLPIVGRSLKQALGHRDVRVKSVAIELLGDVIPWLGQQNFQERLWMLTQVYQHLLSREALLRQASARALSKFVCSDISRPWLESTTADREVAVTLNKLIPCSVSLFADNSAFVARAAVQLVTQILLNCTVQTQTLLVRRLSVCLHRAQLPNVKVCSLDVLIFVLEKDRRKTFLAAHGEVFLQGVRLSTDDNRLVSLRSMELLETICLKGLLPSLASFSDTYNTVHFLLSNLLLLATTFSRKCRLLRHIPVTTLELRQLMSTYLKDLVGCQENVG